MNEIPFTAERSDAMRAALADHVRESASSVSRARRIWAAILAGGAGASRSPAV